MLEVGWLHTDRVSNKFEKKVQGSFPARGSWISDFDLAQCNMELRLNPKSHDF